MNNSYDDTDKSSCTREDALGIIIGLGRIRILPPKHDAPSEEWKMHGQINVAVMEYLNEQYTSLSSEYSEAKFDKLPAVAIAKKLAELNEIKAYIKDAKDVLPYLDDEVAKLAHGQPSTLRIDQRATEIFGVERYTYISVQECVKAIRSAIRKSKNLTTEHASEQQDEQLDAQPTDKKPWFIKNPLDEPTDNNWYPAARYFARLHIDASPNQKISKKSLAYSIEKLMVNHKVYDRNGKKPPNQATIRNALIGMNKSK